MGLILYRHHWDITLLRWLAGYPPLDGSVTVNGLATSRTKKKRQRRGGLAPGAEVIPLDPVDDYAIEEEDMDWLRSLDPADWKQQDHYALLGLKNLRWQASEACLRRAYKRKVLRHHPDKRRGRGEHVDDDNNTDYFTCITRSYEVLGSEVRRRAYDSVDEAANDSVPALGSAETAPDAFYTAFGALFAANARWSKKRPVPALGHATTEWCHVENFYDFWFDFDSWREFSYLDEEDKDKGENRDERRWIERQNKAARQRRRNDEMRRLTRLVETARASDPRVARHDAAEREARDAEKNRRRSEQQARQAQDAEARRQREAAEAEAQRLEAETHAKAQEVARREAQSRKAALKKERRTLRQRCREWEYFVGQGDDQVTLMAACEALVERLAVCQINALNAALQPVNGMTRLDARKVFDAANAQLHSKQVEERDQVAVAAATSAAAAATAKPAASDACTYWSYELTQSLIKAVKMFPSGTYDRWETMATFLNQHVPEANNQVTAKEVLRQTKTLQQDDSGLRQEANRQAYARLAETVRSNTETAKESVPTERIAADVASGAPWSPDEQQALEKALRTFGSDTPNRWERISEAVSGRSKRECMLRFKELVSKVQAKKQAATGAKK